MIVYAEIECIIYDAQSLKEKRSVIKSVLERARNQFNVSIAEVDHQNVWQRTKIEAAAVTNEFKHGEKVIQQVMKLFDQEPRLDITAMTIDRL